MKRYAKDFKGRQIEYKFKDDSRVLMNVNDAMEMLYTFTWGEESYNHEINEQFGYFAPSQYRDFIKNNLGSEAKVTVMEHYLQDGYEEHLLNKIDFMDENYRTVKLPDSTCLIVIEKC